MTSSMKGRRSNRSLRPWKDLSTVQISSDIPNHAWVPSTISSCFIANTLSTTMMKTMIQEALPFIIRIDRKSKRNLRLLSKFWRIFTNWLRYMSITTRRGWPKKKRLRRRLSLATSCSISTRTLTHSILRKEKSRNRKKTHYPKKSS